MVDSEKCKTGKFCYLVTEFLTSKNKQNTVILSKLRGIFLSKNLT